MSSGPGHQPRPPQELAPEHNDVPLAVAAAHHACDAVTSLAHADRERIRTAASAERLLVPTRSLPDTMDIPRPFAPALPDRVDDLLCLYQDTGEAAAEASAEVGQVAAAIRAPSRVLTAARAAVSAGREGSSRQPPQAAGEAAPAGQAHELAGTVQNVLHGLGVTSRGLLQRAADIDRASEQLIIEAAEQRNMHQKAPSTVTAGRSASSTALIALASCNPRPATLPRQPASGQQHEPPEAEP
jgi:hypothetical protein